MQLSPEQFHTLFDRAAQPVLLVQDGVITQCSSRAEGLIAPGSPIRELLPPDAVLQELIAAAPTVLPLRLRTGYVTAQVQPLEGALLLFLPVGDDDACASALSRAAQAVSAPLTTLLSASGTIFPLLADVEDPLLQRNLAVLSRSCYQLLRASENLGDLSAALRGRLPLSMEKTDLTDFLDDFSQTAGDLCLQAGRELDVELPQAPIYLWADRRQLRRVLLALLSNAIKFTAPGSLLRLTLTRRGKRAYLRLTDGGEGMTPEVLTSAFSRYTQPQDDPRTGAGFSLPVVQAVIQAHGGTILLQSQKDRGTDVTLTLPVGLPQEQALLGKDITTIKRGTGCTHCNGTGYRGRIAVHEIGTIDRNIRRMISRGAEIEEIEAYAREQQGMRSLKEKGLELVKQGVTTPEELLRIAYYA